MRVKMTVAVLLAVLFCLLAGALWHVEPVAADNRASQLLTRAVNVDRLHTLDAVGITEVAVGGRRVEVGEFSIHEDRPGLPFQADDDWLKNMTISVRNRTDKTIICGEVRLWFPETALGPDHAQTAYLLRFGQRPESARYHKDGSKILPDTRKAIVLAPGRTFVIRVAEYMDEIQALFENLGTMPLSQVTKLNIQRVGYYFADDTRWENHAYLSPDSEHPGQYKTLDQNYFPGNVARALEMDHK